MDVLGQVCDRMALAILTKDENPVRIPGGPRIVVVEAGDDMYRRGKEEAAHKYNDVLQECMSKCDPAQYKVLSLEGRPAVEIVVRPNGFSLTPIMNGIHKLRFPSDK